MPDGPDNLTLDCLAALPGVGHAFFGRGGGVSGGVYRSLNCGFGSKDAARNVAENRGRAMARIGLTGADLVTAYQVHSNRVTVVEEPWPRAEAPRVDGLVTRRGGLALGVMSADCAPILMADAITGIVGAAHAGWRGALSGIAEAMVRTMSGLGARRAHIVAGVGPAIGRCSYEVGPEFPAPFLDQSRDNEEFFSPANRDRHFLFDLAGFVARRLAEAGVESVESLARDTCAEESRFFSYRRSRQRRESDYGRGLSVIYLAPR